MARTARLVLPGLPHHVTQRGNRGSDVFFTDRERQRYLVWLSEASRQHHLHVWVYCLMSNYVHLIAVPRDQTSLAHVLRDVHSKHVLAINNEHGWSDHLWHGRYFSCVLDEEHLWEAVRYVERNPVRASVVTDAIAYPWSSAAAHCGLRDDAVLSDDLPLLGRAEDWRAWLQDEGDPAAVRRVRLATKKGTLCSADMTPRGVG